MACWRPPACFPGSLHRPKPATTVKGEDPQAEHTSNHGFRVLEEGVARRTRLSSDVLNSSALLQMVLDISHVSNPPHCNSGLNRVRLRDTPPPWEECDNDKEIKKGSFANLNFEQQSQISKASKHTHTHRLAHKTYPAADAVIAPEVQHQQPRYLSAGTTKPMPDNRNSERYGVQGTLLNGVQPPQSTPAHNRSPLGF